MNNFKGKIAVVTGGNSGIGYATAQRLKQEGAQVIITGRTREKVETAADTLGVSGIVADVLNVDALESLAGQVNRDFGPVDVLFVNAGIFTPAPVGHTTEAMFDEQIGINFKGAVFTVEKFLPYINDGASIILLSSVIAYTGMPNTAIYAASKAALNSYMRTASTELAKRHIRVNSVNPGPVATPIFSKSGLPEDQLDGFATAMQERVPLKRFGQPDDIANLVTFLASEKASFITGAEYNIDGGINVNPLLS